MSKCSVCGSSEFDLDYGSLVCTNCGALEENFQELVEDPSEGFMENSKYKLTIKQEEEEGSKKTDEHDWCSYEAYNYILKGWSDTLTHLGVSCKFRETLFKLWIHYLQTIKLAFVPNNNDSSEDNRKGEFKSPFMRPRDLLNLKLAKLVEKETKSSLKKEDELEKLKKKITQNQIRINLKNELKQVHKEMSSTLEHSNILNENEDLASAAEDEFDESIFDSVPLLDTFDCGLFESSNLMQTEDKEEIAKKISSLKKHIFQADSDELPTHVMTYPGFLSLPKLLSIVYLAILISEEDILLLDLLRWCRDGYFPYQSASCLIPENKRFKGEDYRIVLKAIPYAIHLRLLSKKMAAFLSLKIVPIPSEEKVIQKIGAAFNLPDDVLSMVPTVLNALRISIHRHIGVLEITVAAAVLLIFKIYYGLDDEHEEILSDWAEKFNFFLEKKKSNLRIFSWREWQCDINMMNWWLSEMVVNSNSSSLVQLHSTLLTKRFPHYFWNKGIWFRDIATNNVDQKRHREWSDLVTRQLLNLNETNLEKELMQKKYVDGDGKDNFDALRHFMNYSSQEDKTQEPYMFQVGQELLERDFSGHSINWLLHSYRIVAEFEEVGKPIMIVPVPLNQPSKARLCLEVAKKKNEDKKSIFIIPDPLSGSYWTVEGEDFFSNRLSSSFQWLLKVLSNYCQTAEVDLYKQFFILSRAYLSLSSRTNLRTY